MLGADPATICLVFIALLVGSSVGDHWVQSSCQAATKGQPGWPGRWACARHVAGLTLTQGIALLLVWLVADITLHPLALSAGLAINATTHYWADRRTTLARLAKTVGRSEFYSVGSASHPNAPATAAGEPAAHLGTGAYALDQSWHLAWAFIAALVAAL
ncbi:transcriptional regulator [Streptomyces bohaiensis]|uniref:transcriptional regulator n=1 Tax=Streptomyces bohaiensis TaxID=1431344 RepID=UPI003B7A743D